jgi:hypothetical protein
MSESFEVLKKDLQEEIDLRNEAHNESSNMSLFGVYLDMLSSSGQISDDDLTIIDSRNDGIHFAAFARDFERSEIHLFFTDYNSNSDLQKIYKKDLVEIHESVLSSCLNRSQSDRDSFDTGDPIRELLDDLSDRFSKWSRLVVWMTSNRLFSSRDGSTLNFSKSALDIVFNCVDLSYYKSLLTDRKVSEITISTDLPALKVLQNDSYSSYLFSLSGYELSSYYDQYGKRLLESNVRTFLSLRGNTNKGIYNTIHTDQERPFFFAYNNGLTATASKIVFSNSVITSISDLQIVNGGQTMSTIYKAWKDGKNLDGVHVQIKLTVLHDLENKDVFVSRISRFANTQNKVSNSDFFSNSYYHRRMKELSGMIRVSVDGQITPEKWFYERVRGEYQNEQTFLSQTEKNKFRKQYPQVKSVDKIALAKAYLSVNELPHLVSKGAQLCFAEFAKRVADLHDEERILDENDFKQIVAQVIMFRSFEKIVSSSDWYTGGYRAQTVAYTISLFSHTLKKNRMTINWNSIWNGQVVSESLLKELSRFGRAVHEMLINPPAGNPNIGTYSKKEPCWIRIQTISLVPEKGSIGVRYIDAEPKAKRLSGGGHPDKGIAAQMRVVELATSGMPKKLMNFYNSQYAPGIRDRDKGVLSSWSLGRIAYPSEAQAKIIIQALKKAEEAGM